MTSDASMIVFFLRHLFRFDGFIPDRQKLLHPYRLIPSGRTTDSENDTRLVFAEHHAEFLWWKGIDQHKTRKYKTKPEKHERNKSLIYHDESGPRSHAGKGQRYAVHIN